MNGYLLDTHVVLWWLDDPTQLSDQARQVIEDPDNLIYVSAAAAWEMGIKKSLGRLDIPTNLPQVLQSDSIQILDITIRHALAVADLPMLHSDPFDRMHITQANLEGLTLITRDDRVQQYKVNCLTA